MHRLAAARTTLAMYVVHTGSNFHAEKQKRLAFQRLAFGRARNNSINKATYSKLASRGESREAAEHARTLEETIELML